MVSSLLPIGRVSRTRSSVLAPLLASLLFGLALHFAVEGPDLYSNVVPEHRTMFLHSAMGLAPLEFVGFVLGAHVAVRSRHPA